MNTVDLIQKFLELGFKQSALEKYCGLPKGKITDILKGRDRLKQQTRDTIVEGLTKLKEEISNIDTNTTEEGEVGNYSVYVHIFPNEKRYYGISCSPKNRWGFKGNNYKNQIAMWNAIQEYGWDNIKHEIILSGLTYETAKVVESSLINQYKTYIPSLGYNSYT